MHRGRFCAVLIVLSAACGAAVRQIVFNLQDQREMTVEEALDILDPLTLTFDQRDTLSTRQLRKALQVVSSLERLHAVQQLQKLADRLKQHASDHGK